MRPLVPDRALPRVVEARVRRALGSPAQVATATRELDFLLGASSLADQVEALVPTYLRHVKWRGELRWHPRRMADQQVEDVAPLAEARERGRGVLVSFMHHAYYEGLFGALAAQGQSVHPMVTPTMFSASAPGWMLQQRKMGEMGGPAINAAAGSDALREAMAQGKAVAVATDVPSSTPITFLDRPRLGASGVARLALETGAEVVVVTSHPAAGRDEPAVRLRLAALGAAAHDTPEALLATMVARHEEAVRAWPEAYDQPTKRWGVPSTP